eukprot:5392582-Heterocapsa_arctica.AAC.1
MFARFSSAGGITHPTDLDQDPFTKPTSVKQGLMTFTREFKALIALHVPAEDAILFKPARDNLDYRDTASPPTSPASRPT